MINRTNFFISGSPLSNSYNSEYNSYSVRWGSLHRRPSLRYQYDVSEISKQSLGSAFNPEGLPFQTASVFMWKKSKRQCHRSLGMKKLAYTKNMSSNWYLLWNHDFMTLIFHKKGHTMMITGLFAGAAKTMVVLMLSVWPYLVRDEDSKKVKALLNK